MLLYLGAFQFVPLASALGLVLGTALVSALVSTMLGHRGTDPHAVRPLTLLAALVTLALVEAGARALARLRRRHRAAPLSALAKTGCAAEDVGGKSANLARLVRLGVPVPPAWIVPVGAVADGTAGSIARQAAAWAGPRTVVVRSSFVGEDGARSCAGVFDSVGGVAGGDVAALEAAVRHVVASGHAPKAAAYGLDARPALLVQEEVRGRHAVVASRPWDGRADVVRVEFEGDARVDLDLGLLARAQANVPGCPDAVALLSTTLAVERAFGGPVQLEAVHDGTQWWFVQARRVPVERRSTFVADGLVALDPYPRSEATWARRGGLVGLAGGLRGALAAAGAQDAAATLSDDRFRLVDGRAYVDADAVRAVATSRSTGLGLLRQLRFTFIRPDTPSAADDIPTLHAAQAEAVLRLSVLTRFVDAAAAHPPMPRVVVSFLRARRDAAAATRDALGEALRAFEPDAPGEPGPDRRYEPPLAEPGDGTTIPIVDRPFEGVVVRADEGGVDAASATPPASVLVVPDGDPRWLPRALVAGAVILERGGTLSHLATVLAERDIPCVLATGGRRLPTGARVRFDGRGLVELRG